MFGFGVTDITSFVGDGFQECVECARKRYPGQDSRLFTEGIPEDDYRPVFSYEDNHVWICECGTASDAYEWVAQEVREEARKGALNTEIPELDTDELGHDIEAELVETAVINAVDQWFSEGNDIETYSPRDHAEELRALGKAHAEEAWTEWLDKWAAAIKAEEAATYDADLFTV